MANVKKINIEVAYANNQTQRIIHLTVDEFFTVERAIDCSGILMEFPEIDLSRHKVGVFSKQKLLTDIVKDGDRIEIYRALMIDPKEARKNRIKK